MRAHRHAISLFAAALLATACSSPDTDGADRATAAENTAEEDRLAVENAVRSAYEDEGAEVTAISMALSPDGSRYEGRATVRDPESGTEMAVDCRYTTDVTGAPRLNCDRVTDDGE
ncbi:hypothetical protein HFP57_17380 [Parasphingopyxis algicola]|uniref:hypothetical protein n=1 Tax=Parasphingopyxis algicola TaxID=2026624 RepID=UPI0015A2CEB1|nr:hypothetical protein [Parasphingopyxis algicola]QLC26633.1 hypothetical protein HFP57_17380 [Parasphingopyxis algicola]